MERTSADLNAMIREEQRMTALESQNEAWADGIASGIEPDIMAEAALTTVFGELSRESGEQAALAMLDRIREMVVAGEFHPVQTRH